MFGKWLVVTGNFQTLPRQFRSGLALEQIESGLDRYGQYTTLKVCLQSNDQRMESSQELIIIWTQMELDSRDLR